ncbi:MAG: hypothetical protein JSS75_11875 [Bacteroidetes bacterium]|nr:hypothetical protein [Bacteroidota bacterium]
MLLFVLTASTSSTAQTHLSVADSEQTSVLPFEVSFSGSTAIGPNNTWLWEGGFGFSYLLSDHMRVGFEQLGYASTTLLSGNRSALVIAPMVEYHEALTSSLHAVAAAGVPLQIRFGADLNTRLGAAPFVRVGLDVFTSRSFSIGLMERFSYVISNAYIMTDHGLPSGAMIYATGLALKYHF